MGASPSIAVSTEDSSVSRTADVITVRAGGCLSQPAGVPHNVIARSDDLELIEINLPAQFSTLDVTDHAGHEHEAVQP